MENFNELLQKYADFIVRVGVNPQPGQTLIINCPLEGAPQARVLRSTGMAVAEVAQRTGYRSPSALIAALRRAEHNA